ncbi:QueT transporter family protein [Flavonifractor plautii]|uniref:QueT transporter family protein n=1 Tax=Flavonifractor plautii TaxID=292800 RepID=UPI0024BB95C6|nr:QueT transporter family protein [Flavonifractor plautii]
MRKFTTRDLTLAAIIAAVYAVLTVALPIPQFGPVQCRLAEAMTILPFFFPGATPGLVVGCFIANLFSPYPLDVLCGTLATLLACLLTQRMPNRWLAPLPPVLCNAVIVGAEVAWFETGFTAAFPAAYALNAFTVGLGELAACYVLGSLLISVLPRITPLRALIPEKRLARL